VIAVPLTGTGTAADIALSAASLAFGSRLVASTSPAQTVTITNPGNAPLVISANSLTGTHAADFALSTTCGTPVAPGGTCTYSVTFTPGATGARTASLQLTTNTTPAVRTIGLTGTGVAPAAAVTPTSLTFPSTTVGATSAAQTVTLSNPGSSPLTVSGVTITGTNAADYARTTTCATVAAGGSCTIAVTFSPAAAGTRSGTLSIATDAGTQSVPLTGTGVAPTLTLAPTALTFPNSALLVSSAARVITVTNPGNAPLTVSGVTVGGTNAADFTRTTTCATVAAGGSCTISVVFRPSANGVRTGTVTVASNAGSQVATLTGTGGFPTATLSATTIAFGNQGLTTTSAVRNVTVTNSGVAPLTVSSVALTGANSGDFVLTNGCTATVAVGGTCTVGVAFRPTVAAARTASVTITSNAQTATGTIALTGTGITLTVPGAPTIGAVTRGNAAATVAWTAPANNGGSAITGYLVQPFVTGVASGAPQAAGATATSLVTGLTNGTSYTF
jgi:hypothetical protein